MNEEITYSDGFIMLMMLKKAKKPLRTSYIAKRMGLSVNETENILKNLAKLWHVERISKGVYQSTI
jgi:Mn-dependent DtxR family transcriptional regulator